MFTKDSLKNSTLSELRQIAENLKLEGYERLKKEYLVEEMDSHTMKYSTSQAFTAISREEMNFSELQ